MNKQQQDKPMIIKLNIVMRVTLIACIAAEYLFFFAFFPMTIHFCFYPLPSLYDSPSLSYNYQSQPSYYWNIFVYSLFWIQHIIMSTVAFKKTMAKIIPFYPVYQRFIFNISSELLYLWILSNARPTNYLIFQMPSYISYTCLAVGSIFYITSEIQLGDVTMFTYSPTSIIKDKQIKIEPYTSIKSFPLTTTLVYGLCRHPMQFGLFLLLCMSGSNFSIDRLIFSSIVCFGIFIGIYLQQKKLKKTFKEHAQYKKIVPYVFIPKIF